MPQNPIQFQNGVSLNELSEPRAGSAVLHILLHVINAHLRQSSGASSASVVLMCLPDG
jgi:hypothetical protein